MVSEIRDDAEKMPLDNLVYRLTYLVSEPYVILDGDGDLLVMVLRMPLMCRPRSIIHSCIDLAS